MEVRMQPRTEGHQRSLSFSLAVNPQARVMSYRDYLGNTIHHFDVPQPHAQLAITAEALVESHPAPEIPESLSIETWKELDALASGDAYEMVKPSHFARSTEQLEKLRSELRFGRDRDPLTAARGLNEAVFQTFDYKPKSTKVDSPIDEALEMRRGVCQDFAHILIALLRGEGIPARYVSGYLFHRGDTTERSVDGTTHAWVEALLPRLGWIGFDPTNRLLAGERHIRTPIGRDYADVPPTLGVFKGTAESALHVSVRVSPSEAPPGDYAAEPEEWIAAELP
jgi:transglutaminase-like putative cysteine protease